MSSVILEYKWYGLAIQRGEEASFRFQVWILCTTSGFWPRVRARELRAPVFLGSLTCQTGRCAPPAHRSFGAPHKIKNKYFGKKMHPFWPELGPPGAYIFPLG
jgi:hypothetical protein